MNFSLTPLPTLKDLVLLGGGHSHVAVLKRFGMQPIPGVRVTLVSRVVETPYSGMLPGLIAGHYTRDEAHIDLQPLARFAGARPIYDEVVGLDTADKQVRFATRPPVSYDVLSIDIGSTPHLSVPGADRHAVPVKPIDRLLERWEAMTERLRTGDDRRRVAVVGGGAGGVELLLAIQYCMQTLLRRDGRADAHLEYHLFADSAQLLPTHNRSVRNRFERVLRARRVHIHAGSPVVQVDTGALRTADGRQHDVDEVLWTTQAAAAPWIARSGLAVDEAGFVSVSSTLQSTSHPEVFAAGDIASMVDHPRPKSGVFAVRQGPPLARNLRRALLGERLEHYKPQRQFLSLISTGNKYAVASRGPFAFEGEWVWRWKDWIDRRFMQQYNELPAMPPPVMPALPSGLADAEVLGVLSTLAMRCGGCGAKVGASVLERALHRVGAMQRDEVLIGLGSPDDAAVIATSEGRASVHTIDFFRAMIDDPFVFGQIAATHALSDVYAMGGEPDSALALVTLPPGPEPKQEEMLAHLLSGAVAVLKPAGATLVGGHTSESAELGLGFSVNGRVDPARIMRKSGLQPGDRLIVTKALGTGTLFAADMRHRAKGRWIAGAIRSMLQSNREAACCFQAHGATACTDVTGFGFVGHLVEMLNASGMAAELQLHAVPLLEGAEETITWGIFSSLQPQNIRLRRAMTADAPAARHPRYASLFDPQTSGGLLAGVPAAAAAACVHELHLRGYVTSAVVGTVLPRDDRTEIIAVRG